MIDLALRLLRLAAGAPLATAGVLWWLAVTRARRLRTPWSWLGPIAVLAWLWKSRRDLRGPVVALSVALVLAVWALLLATWPQLRYALLIAVPAGCAVGCWVAAVGRYGSMPMPTALRTALATMRTKEVMRDAVHGSVAGAVVHDVVAQPDGTVEAMITGPVGVAHDDLLAGLRGTLAESVLAVSGRPMASVAVVGAGAKGAVKVRCGTVDAYAAPLDIDELLS